MGCVGLEGIGLLGLQGFGIYVLRQGAESGRLRQLESIREILGLRKRVWVRVSAAGIAGYFRSRGFVQGPRRGL